MLQVGIQTIYYWTYMKKIPFVKIVGSVRFPQDEIEEWINAQRD